MSFLGQRTYKRWLRFTDENVRYINLVYFILGECGGKRGVKMGKKSAHLPIENGISVISINYVT